MCDNQHQVFPFSAAVIRKFPASEMNIHSISSAGKYECGAVAGNLSVFSFLLTVTQMEWNER